MTTSGTGCVPPRPGGHLFPRLLGQSDYNDRVKNAAPLMEAALRWLADQTPGSAELLRLMDATPVSCGQSALPVAFALVLGFQADAHCDLRRDRHRVRPGQP